MIRPLIFAVAVAACMAGPAAAGQQQDEPTNSPRDILERILDRVLGPGERRRETAEPVEAVNPGDIPLSTILAAGFRAEDAARDQYRHPAETLAFFRVDPGMTVAEYAPGGGWYTRILAPWIAQRGRYLAVNAASGEDAASGFATGFPARVQQWTGVPAASVTAFDSDEIPAGLEGTADRILIFRNIHSLLNGNVADSELRNLRRLLADDGLIGVVQHRAPESEQWERASGSRGYVKQSDVIALFDQFGFELVQSSEINANPNDRADYERGVWTLPPTYTLGDTNRDRYAAIGESDRMTLLFRKAD